MTTNREGLCDQACAVFLDKHDGMPTLLVECALPAGHIRRQKHRNDKGDITWSGPDLTEEQAQERDWLRGEDTCARCDEAVARDERGIWTHRRPAGETAYFCAGGEPYGETAIPVGADPTTSGDGS